MHSQGQVMSQTIDRAAARGILILLDMHNLHEGANPPELWYDYSSSQADFQKGWANLVSHDALGRHNRH